MGPLIPQDVFSNASRSQFDRKDWLEEEAIWSLQIEQLTTQQLEKRLWVMQFSVAVIFNYSVCSCKMLWSGDECLAHFADEQTEAQRGKSIGSSSRSAAEPKERIPVAHVWSPRAQAVTVPLGLFHLPELTGPRFSGLFFWFLNLSLMCGCLWMRSSESTNVQNFPKKIRHSNLAQHAACVMFAIPIVLF